MEPAAAAAEGGEPARVVVRRPNGDLVAELLLNPEKKVVDIKRQIAGLEGTPVGCQALRFKGRPLVPLEDSATLLSLEIRADCGAAELVLARCEPLLRGRLTPAQLEHVLSDADALEQAIDAFTDQPQYTEKEVQEIVNAVSSALFEPAARVDAVGRALCASSESLPPPQPDAAASRASSRAARRACFTKAVRAALSVLQEALQKATRPEGMVKGALAEGDLVYVDKEGTTGPDALQQPPAPSEIASGQEAGEPSPPQARMPWTGAGRELEEKLHRRFAASEAAPPAEAPAPAA